MPIIKALRTLWQKPFLPAVAQGKYTRDYKELYRTKHSQEAVRAYQNVTSLRVSLLLSLFIAFRRDQQNTSARPMSSEHGEQTAVALYRLSHMGHTQSVPSGGKVVGDDRLPDIHFQRFNDFVHGRATTRNQ
jgi:hypothetical protein